MQANAYPAKRFFVEMLTRDIDLPDAILDLLDNCVDGAIRSGYTEEGNAEFPYKGYYANINVGKDGFSIEDNCGGIDTNLARDYAFRFGRPDPERDADLPTVGVYGIGMKRAIFKLGTDCLIQTRHPSGAFEVHIESDWMEDDKKWELDMALSQTKEPYGTSIVVAQLHSSIALAFDESKDSFVERFQSQLERHYSYIIEKGLVVKLNGIEVKPRLIRTLFDNSVFQNQDGIAPYVYETVADGVAIKLVMGLYERLPSEADVDESLQGTRSKSDAGWTIICNDRVVLDSDKTHLTGWGEAGVPHYHSQFVALAGVVSFVSADAKKLPVKTTKRGIDQESALYAMIKEEMREALKTFTSFTNHWKGQSDERTSIQENATLTDVRSAAAIIPDHRWTNVSKGAKGRRFKPDLPKAKQARTHARIQFQKSLSDISIVRDFLCDEPATKPADVGIAAFDWALTKAQQ